MDEYSCHQDRRDRDQLIDQAERNEFSVKRVEIEGNTYTRGREFFRRTTDIREGDIFTKKNLETSVKRIAKMKTIYPITVDNVKVRLDLTDKTIDIVFCVRQKPKR